ncbi:MAG: type II toxin-antitoxin system VapC family toxin [Planctomycetes bacterium]|nr:type II toxin-antitoxin system VapC family toxin [Planctomycetota bacterium]
MIPENALVLLDTTILVELARGRTAGEKIDAKYRLRERREKPLISVVTHGEILTLARVWNWGAQKVEFVKDLLRELVIVDVSRRPVIERYAEIAAFAKANGLALSDNDAWIAATAAATDSWLLTEDKDFDSLHGKFIQREWVDLESLK